MKSRRTGRRARRADLRDGDGVDAARPVAVVDDPPVLARRLEGVEAAELWGVAARRADGADQLVEGELVVDLMGMSSSTN